MCLCHFASVSGQEPCVVWWQTCVCPDAFVTLLVWCTNGAVRADLLMYVMMHQQSLWCYLAVSSKYLNTCAIFDAFVTLLVWCTNGAVRADLLMYVMMHQQSLWCYLAVSIWLLVQFNFCRPVHSFTHIRVPSLTGKKVSALQRSRQSWCSMTFPVSQSVWK